MDSREDEKALAAVLDQLQHPQAFLHKVHELYGSEAESHDFLEFKDGRLFERFSSPHRAAGAPVGRVWSFREISAQGGAPPVRQATPRKTRKKR